MAFAVERLKRRPAPIAVLVDLEHGNASVSVDTFETAWTGQSLQGDPDFVQVTTESAIKTQGDRSNKVEFHRGHVMNATQLMDASAYMSVSHLSVIGRTIAAADLSNKNSLTVQVRSDVTGALLRFGMGEATSTEYQQDLLSIGTANQFLRRSVDLSGLANSGKDAITRLRYQFLGSTGGLGRNATMYLDDLSSVDYKRYSNRAMRFSGDILPPLQLDSFDSVWTNGQVAAPDYTAISLEATLKTEGVASNKWQFFRTHPMDTTQLMDATVPMAQSVNSVIGRTIPAISLGDRNFLFLKIRSDVTGALLRFGMGEATSTELTSDLSIPSANVFKSFTISLASITPLSKDAITRLRFQFLGSTGGLGRTVTMYVDDLVATRTNDRNTATYKVYAPKLLGVGAVAHALRANEAAGLLANMTLQLANTDGEFYRLRDTEIMLNRAAVVRVGFEGDPESEYQTAFQGKIQDEGLNDRTYTIGLEDMLAKFYRDLPFTPVYLGTYPNAATADIGRLLPMAFGRCRNVTPRRVSVVSNTYLFNDGAYGVSKAVKAVRIGARTVGVASYTSDLTNGKVTLTFATPSAVTMDVDGYRDDTDGTYTGTPTALIEQPSDVVRFVGKKILGMTVDDLDEPSLDTARTTWAGFRVARYLDDRQSSFQLLTSGSNRDGLAQNIFGYFYADNVSGKARLISQSRNTTGATSGNYHERGANANMLTESYSRHTTPRNLINQVEVAYAYSPASGLYKDMVRRIDSTSQNDVSGYGKTEIVRIQGQWIPPDLNGLTLQYVGTAGSATCTVTGEDDDATIALRTTVTGHASENLLLSCTNTSYNTLQKLVTYIDGLAAYTASLPTSANGSLDSRGLRDITARSISSSRTLAFSFGKLLAVNLVDRYKDDHDEVRWISSLAGFSQRLGDVVQVQTIGETQSRRVRIYETKRQPLEGKVELIGEIE